MAGSEAEIPAVDVWECVEENDAPELDRLLRCCAWLAVDARNELGETALHVAASRGHDDVARVLLRHRADLAATDAESGWTPLHRAVYSGRLSTSLLLLRHAQLHGGKKFAKTCLHGAYDYEGRSAMDLLSRRSTDALLVEAEAVPSTESLRGGMVYTFGKRDYQLGYHLPNADVQSTPRRVELSISSPIRQISASKYHTIALNAAGECFVWGFGKGGRLGTGTEFDHVEPTRIAYLEQIPIAKVAAGENHSLALSCSGQVFSWGSNSFGQLGHNSKTLSHQARLTPKRIDAFKGLAMVEIAASGCHSAAISSEADGGIVYTWGSNKKGQLGRKEGAGTDQPYPTPRAVDALILDHPLSAIYEDYDAVHATHLALSDWHSCVILRCTRNGKSHGQVWQFGYGSNYPTRVNFKDSKRRTGSVLLSDTWVPTWAHRVTDIVQISCAQNHSIALASSGVVFTWGHNESALSHNTSNKKARQRGDDGIPGAPRTVELAKYGPIASICASQDHCAVVTQAGDLVTWGGGAQGVLGHGLENTWQPNPKRVPGVKKAVAVAAGHQHTVVLVAPSQPSFAEMMVTVAAPAMSLGTLLQQRIAEWLDISNCATIWKYAEDYDARSLQAYCADYMGRNWDAFLDLMCKERMETLFELFLPPPEEMELERKSTPALAARTMTPSMSPRPVPFAGADSLDSFSLGGKTPSHTSDKKKLERKKNITGAEDPLDVKTPMEPSSLELSATVKPITDTFPDLRHGPPTSGRAGSDVKRKHGKFVRLDQFFASSESRIARTGALQDKARDGGGSAFTAVPSKDAAGLLNAAAIPGGLTSPWKIPAVSTPIPKQHTVLHDETSRISGRHPTAPERKRGVDASPSLAPLARTRKESLGSHPTASPRVTVLPSPVLSSSGVGNKSVLGADGVERPQIASFSLDAFIKKPSRNARKNRRGLDDGSEEVKPVVSWRGVTAGTSPSSPSLMPFVPAPTMSNNHPQLKTLKEIQAEEEARIAAEAAAKTRLGTYSRRTASTVNSWGLCESQGHVSLADVQKLEEEQAFIEEQRQILAEIERERAAASKSAGPKGSSTNSSQGERRRVGRGGREEERGGKAAKKTKKKDSRPDSVAEVADGVAGAPRRGKPSKGPRSSNDAGDGVRGASTADAAETRRSRKKKPSAVEETAASRQPRADKKAKPDRKPAKQSAKLSKGGREGRAGVPAA